MAQDWYYNLDGKTELGPVSSAGLRELVRSGQLTPESMVRQGASDRWTPARKVRGLFQEEVKNAIPIARPVTSEPSPASPVAQGEKAGMVDTLRTHPVALVLSLVFCFPFGLALIWTNKTWSPTRKWVWTGGWASFVVLMTAIAAAQQLAIQKALDDADRLWAGGQKAEAVTKYKTLIDGDVKAIEPDRRPTAFQRVVEFEADQGNMSVAKHYILEAEKHHVVLTFGTQAVRRLTAKGDELKDMSLGQITDLLGPPDERHQSQKPPHNMWLYVWRSDEEKYIVVTFIRNLITGEPLVMVAFDDRPRYAVENMKQVLHKN